MNIFLYIWNVNNSLILQKSKNILLFLLITGLSILSVSCNNDKKTYPVAKKGVLDLRGWDFDRDGNIALNGEWKFYWKELINPNDSILKDITEVNFIKVPGLWKNAELEGKSYSPHGYATYSLDILLDSANQWLKLHTKVGIAAASIIYVNGEEVGSNGIV